MTQTETMTPVITSPLPQPGGFFYHQRLGEVVQSFITKTGGDQHGRYVEIFGTPGRFYWSFFGPIQSDLKRIYDKEQLKEAAAE